MELEGLPWLDLAIAGLLGVSAAIGLWRGFTREALALLVWALAVWAAVVGYPQAAALFPAGWDTLRLSLGETAFTVTRLRAVLGFAAIVLLVLLVGSVLSRVLLRHLFVDAFRLTDRFLGAVYGVARGVVLVVGFALLAGLTRFPFGESWAASRLVPVFQAGAEAVVGWLPAGYRDYFAYPPRRPLPFGLGDKLHSSRSQDGSV